MRRMLALALSLIPCVLGSHRDAVARDLTLEDRIKAQEAIGRVYWKHRLWPAENHGAKPPLEAVLSRAQIRARVEDYLKKPNALERTWKRPITATQLHAKMERMASRTRSPEVLREIFAALVKPGETKRFSGTGRTTLSALAATGTQALQITALYR